MDPTPTNSGQSFFVPTVDSQGKMEAEDAEKAWRACRKGAEGDHGAEALARRVYRLRYVHDGNEIEAVVGEPDFYDRETVIAIIALPGLY